MEQLDIHQSPAQSPDTQIVRLTGPLTLATLFQFRDMLRKPESKGLILDISGVPYMDSAALGAILGQFAHAQRHGYRFAVAGVVPRVQTIFEITHTDSILPIYDTAEAADIALAKTAKA